MSRSSFDSYHGPRAAPSFDEALHEQLRKTPWVGASVLVHGVVLGFLLLLPTDPAAQTTVQITQIANAPEITRLEEPDEPEEPPVDTDVEPSPDDPLIDDLPIEDQIDKDEDMEDTGPLGDPRFTATSPFESMSTNGIIGIGANAGGPYGDRTGGRRNASGRGGPGGDAKGTDRSVTAALGWLARHQSPDGRWDSDGFSHLCKSNVCDGEGEAPYDPGVSGLALLAFLGAGETHVAGDHKETVRAGLGYLRGIQDAEGCFGPRTSQHFQYNHTISTLAMAEAFGMTGSRPLREPAQRAVGFVQQSQNPYLAWRYGVRDGDNDTSVTGWAVMALKSARMAGLEVDGGALRGAAGWIEKMTEPEFGRVGYQRRGGPPARTADMVESFPAEHSESMTAAGVLTRIFSGEDPTKSEMIRKGADLMAKKPPRWDVDAGSIDMYYWYYGTLAMHQVGGAQWKRWNESMKSALVGSQRLDAKSDEYGSWDPIGPWGREGGRVYATAVQALSLEVYYRYKRVSER